MDQTEFVLNSQDELSELAAKLLQYAGDIKIFLFSGEMGSGKTTLIKSLCKELGSNDHFSSPTFSLVNEYQSPKGKIYHLDLYRIRQAEELMDIGIDELLDSGNYCFIEWPALVLDLLENKYI